MRNLISRLLTLALSLSLSSIAMACSCLNSNSSREARLVALALLAPDLYEVQILDSIRDAENRHQRGTLSISSAIKGSLAPGTRLPHDTDMQCCTCGRRVEAGQKEWRGGLSGGKPVEFTACDLLVGVEPGDAAVAVRARGLVPTPARPWAGPVWRRLPSDARSLRTEPRSWWWLEDVQAASGPVDDCTDRTGAQLPVGTRRAELWLAHADPHESARVRALRVESPDGERQLLLPPGRDGLLDSADRSDPHVQLAVLDRCARVTNAELQLTAQNGWVPRPGMLIEPDGAGFFTAEWTFWSRPGRAADVTIKGVQVWLPRVALGEP